jgi:hypothetical protein
MVDEAMRLVLVNATLIGPDESVAGDSDIAEMVDMRSVGVMLSALDLVGQPLRTRREQPDTAVTLAERIGILGNPTNLDVSYTGGWHFAQYNRWDSWFTIAPIPTGGYRIATPATRLHGDHGPAIMGEETDATLSDDGRFHFEMAWRNGTRGAYSGGVDPAGGLSGHCGDASIAPRQNVIWEGSRMPVKHDSAPAAAAQPSISVGTIPNTSQDGYNVTVGGAGFFEGAAFEVQGRVIARGVTGEWAPYAAGTTDEFGTFGATFGVVKPLGYRYVFRADVQHAGLTPEVGFS